MAAHHALGEHPLLLPRVHTPQSRHRCACQPLCARHVTCCSCIRARRRDMPVQPLTTCARVASRAQELYCSFVYAFATASPPAAPPMVAQTRCVQSFVSVRASAACAAGQGDRRSGRCACPPWASTWPRTCPLAALGPCVQQLPPRYVCESRRARQCSETRKRYLRGHLGVDPVSKLTVFFSTQDSGGKMRSVATQF